MKLRKHVRSGALFTAIILSAIAFAPAASAHSPVRVGVGVSLPGITVGVGNCRGCDYWNAPRVYREPAYLPAGYYGQRYQAPVYYLDPPYYVTRPVRSYGYYGYPRAYYGYPRAYYGPPRAYYGHVGYYGGYAPYYRAYHYGYGDHWNHGQQGGQGWHGHHDGHDQQGGYYHHGH